MTDKVLLLFNSDGPQPINKDYTEDFKKKDYETEAHVLDALRDLKHHHDVLGIYDDIHQLCIKIEQYKPKIIINLVERFKNDTSFDQHIASFLELEGIPFTGCGSLGLSLCKDKGLSKKILSFHRIHVPDFVILRKGKPIARPRRMSFPIFVKPLKEEASYGIAQKSFVENDDQFTERVSFIQDQMNEDVIAEEYIEGREFYVSILGNRRLEVFPIRELKFREVPSEEPKFASFKAKWDEEYRKKWGIKNEFADPLPGGVREAIEALSKKIYRLLSIKGYARLDLRLTPEGKIYFIEANPNPILSWNEDFAESALKTGLSFSQLIARVLKLAQSH